MSDAPHPLILLNTPYGNDRINYQKGTLHGVSFIMRERISRPFDLVLTAVSTRQAINPDTLLHQPVTATIKFGVAIERNFNGVVRSVTSVNTWARDRATYRLNIVPTLWFMSQSENCRIFQRLSVTSILKQLFSEHSLTNYKIKVSRPSPRREYVTQYNETDLEFAHRLMQEEGLFYFFLHTEAAHTLIITDYNGVFQKVDQPLHRAIEGSLNTNVFDRWKTTASTASGSDMLQDYDPLYPDMPVQGFAEAKPSTPGDGQRKRFRWPVMTFDDTVANNRARFRIEAEVAAAGLREGHGCDPTFYPGSTFVLKDEPVGMATNVNLALLSVTHVGRDMNSVTRGGPPASYSNSFTCFLEKTPWREPLDIRRPCMAGLYSGVVLGEGSEEIHADRLGRIKVRLKFDYRKDTIAGEGIWVRVAQPWAGDRWGWQHLPRVGTEVAVAFMNGDPDDPVVAGGLYNQDMKPVFDIPREQTKSGFRSRSTLKGSSDEYCELSFDDDKGRELVYLQAQKDLKTKVKHDQSLHVDNNRDVFVGQDETVTVVRNHGLTSLSGNISVAAVDGAVEISALTSLSLRVLDNVIRISPAGIAINGNLLNLTALGVLNASAPSVNLMGDADVTITAPIVFSTPEPVPNPAPEIDEEEFASTETVLMTD